ncbi:UDP-glucuronic acid decarboxylase 1-like [Photinus pyralis]|uniref:UDP-glucuronic acid decarboxylase 1-like n=1 Tax=Photinus pyralis TaxID=7054 RepID=UPI00126706CF|nr:UDP-glucuronic acid decarboxylase 1-like [Photinus pyralis]XP_031352031.1 UDP-glucuronic acid decarboxylase 1-like [Photinus pyralis]
MFCSFTNFRILVGWLVCFLVIFTTSIYLLSSRDRNEKVYTRASLLKSSLEDAAAGVRELQEKLRVLESWIPKQHEDVTFLNYLRKKRIAITGGAGFVGSHLVDKLIRDGHEVVVVDNFLTGRRKNVEQWLDHANFELIHHDIINPLYIEVDQIYHLASPASPPHYMANPVKTIKTNSLGTLNMLGLAKRVNATILIASSSEVYGDPEIHPQPETYWGHVNPIGPRACYDEGKRIAETLTYAYAKMENTDVRVARIFNTYGPRMHLNDGRVVSNFILQALQGHDITIYGGGEQTRSFQYVSDLVDGLIALMNSNYTLPVNLGNPIEHTINEFAMIIKEVVGGDSEITHVAPIEDDPQKRKPEIRRAKKHIGWEPKVSLSDGLQKTAEYFRGELKLLFVNNASLSST